MLPELPPHHPECTPEEEQPQRRAEHALQHPAPALPLRGGHRALEPAGNFDAAALPVAHLPAMRLEQGTDPVRLGEVTAGFGGESSGSPGARPLRRNREIRWTLIGE